MARPIKKEKKNKRVRNFRPLTNEQVWDVFKNHIPLDRDDFDEEKEPEFDWFDLEGKTIANTRRIENPREYNSLACAGNPLYFQVIEFLDNSILLFDAYQPDDEDVTTYVNAYYFNGKEVSLSDDLFY
ncbi:hypothetical protein KY312_00125 [Candidatus Woesearchaeota archaeon]|nr:hypothetical protein [Candidatus Woesearchaeota archaeon]